MQQAKLGIFVPFCCVLTNLLIQDVCWRTRTQKNACTGEKTLNTYAVMPVFLTMTYSATTNRSKT